MELPTDEPEAMETICHAHPHRVFWITEASLIGAVGALFAAVGGVYGSLA
jgi:hypothetical protein